MAVNHIKKGIDRTCMHIWKHSKSISACISELFLGYGNNGILYRRPGLRKSMPQYLMH